MNFFEILQTFSGNAWLYGGSFVLVLSLLVFIHEWGHYIVARMCGVRVEEFSIGFGKEIAGFTDKSGTRWRFSLIPLGGYVKLFGDSDPASASHDDTVEGSGGEKREMTQAERDVSFFAKPVWKRAAVVIAGPAINYIFAIIVLTLLFVFNGQPVTPPSAAAVIQGSAADQAGFKPHDLIISIDGRNIQSFEDVRREMLISLDRERHFIIERDGKTMDIFAKPEKVESEDRLGFMQSRGVLGLISPRHAVDIKTIKQIDGKDVAASEDFSALRKTIEGKLGKVFNISLQMGKEIKTLTIHPLEPFNEDLFVEDAEAYDYLFVSDVAGNIFAKYSVHEAAGKAVKQSWDVSVATVEALGQIITGNRSATELGGIIRIGALAGDMAKQGMIALILFTAMLSINLGLINLFPIPLLDGGHLIFYAFEAVLGKPIPEQIQEYAFRFGLVFLVGVMVFANLNDLIQLFL